MILLARHGQTDHNADPVRVMGRTDIALNDLGREQAAALAASLLEEPPAAIWTSPLQRARQTAEIVGERLGLAPRRDPRLAESDRGDWEGREVEEIRRTEPELWAAWLRAGPGFRFPGGESLAEHAARVGAALEAVGDGPLPALVVCHGGTIRCAAALRHPRGLDAYHELDVPHATVIRLPATAGQRS